MKTDSVKTVDIRRVQVATAGGAVSATTNEHLQQVERC